MIGIVFDMFQYAIIEYTFTAHKYVDASTWIKFDELPGPRINLLTQQNEYIFSPETTTHIWHGFQSHPWSTQSDAEKTEFLTTTQMHFYVNGEEVPLTHVLLYDVENDYAYSLFYRVFPPSYFEENRNNKLVGEWIHMEGGVWTSDKNEATVRVQ